MREYSTNERIGRKIKALRIEKKLTQLQLADELSINQKHLSNIENGRRSITIVLLDKLCEFFNKPHVYFFDFNEYDIDEKENKLINTILYLLQSSNKETRKKIFQIINVLVEKNNL